MRLIDADVSIEKLKSLPIELDAKTIQRCIEVLSNMPSADRPRGEWINIDTKLFRVQCSACRVWSDVVGNYCPWCGAEMKGVNNE